MKIKDTCQNTTYLASDLKLILLTKSTKQKTEMKNILYSLCIHHNTCTIAHPGNENIVDESKFWIKKGV